jgi:hypothetical protein
MNVISTGFSTSRSLRKDCGGACSIATAPLPGTERARATIAWSTCAAASDRSSTIIGRMAAGGELVPARRLAVLPIPGDHGSVLDQRWRPDVASAIQQALEQADRY